MKKFYKVLSLAVTSSIVVYTFVASINQPTGIANASGAPGETICTSCHMGAAANSGGGSITITSNIPTNGYIGGAVYQVRVTVAQSERTRFGFDFEALKTSDLANAANAGTLAVLTTDTKLITLAGKVNVTHTSNAPVATIGSKTFTFNWTAPAASFGSVTFYAAGVAANGAGGNAGDFVYNTRVVVNPSGTVAVDEASSQIAGLKVFPVPSNDKINLSYQLINSGFVNIELQDMNGKIIHTFMSQNMPAGNLEHSLDVSTQKAGVYFIKISSIGKVAAKMIVIN